MTRKTIAIDTLKEKINRMLAVPTTNIPTDQKQILSSLLEEVLMDSGNYQGFKFINMSLERAKTVTWGDDDFFNRKYF